MKTSASSAALVAVLALAGPALATPSGHKWFDTNLPSSYKVYNHSSINGVSSFSTNVLPRIQVAFQNWTKTKIACTKWDIAYLGTFSSPSGTSAISGGDNQNLVIWLGGASWRYSSGTLGLTTTTYYSGSGEIFDADMELNNDVLWSSSGASGAFDFESIVLHEAGHFLGLDHTTNNGIAVMYPTIAPGEIKRSLQSPDLTDVCGVYPGSGTPGSQGSGCLADNNCVSGLWCRTVSGSSVSKICTVDCTAGQACPTGYTCQNANVGKACLVPVGSPDLCKFCTAGTDCSTGICVTDDGRHNWCTISCPNAQACGTGYDCLPGPGGGNVCVPQTACTGQCTSPSNCAIGYGCVSTNCEATGNVGDRCEVSVYCKPCGVCIGTASAASCRACCGGGSGSGECQGCTNTSCGTGLLCQGVSGSTDQVCIPNAGASTCSGCSTSIPCAAGGTCVGGRCHTSCNPAAPGGCSACYDIGGGTGYCACADEVALAGQACGPSGGGAFKACASGLACVSEGSASTCHRTCTLGDPASCNAGDACQTVQGKAVCVAGTTAGSRCNPCNAGTCAAGLTCFQGQCYQPCNPTSPVCTTCVTTGTSTGVCACPNQLAGVNQTCGYVPPGDVYSCQAGLTCIASVCRSECNLNNPITCIGGTTCQVKDGTPFCLPPVYDFDAGGGGGGSAGGGGGGSTGGGGGGSTGGGGGGGGDNVVNPIGCGCGATSGALALWPLLVAYGVRRRRRAGRRSPRA